MKSTWYWMAAPDCGQALTVVPQSGNAGTGGELTLVVPRESPGGIVWTWRPDAPDEPVALVYAACRADAEAWAAPYHLVASLDTGDHPVLAWRLHQGTHPWPDRVPALASSVSLEGMSDTLPSSSGDSPPHDGGQPPHDGGQSPHDGGNPSDSVSGEVGNGPTSLAPSATHETLRDDEALSGVSPHTEEARPPARSIWQAAGLSDGEPPNGGGKPPNSGGERSDTGKPSAPFAGSGTPGSPAQPRYSGSRPSAVHDAPVSPPKLEAGQPGAGGSSPHRGAWVMAIGRHRWTLWRHTPEGLQWARTSEGRFMTWPNLSTLMDQAHDATSWQPVFWTPVAASHGRRIAPRVEDHTLWYLGQWGTERFGLWHPTDDGIVVFSDSRQRLVMTDQWSRALALGQRTGSVAVYTPSAVWMSFLRQEFREQQGPPLGVTTP